MIFNKKKELTSKIKSSGKENFVNLNIFKKIIESEKITRKDSKKSINLNESYINHSTIKVNNFGGVNNSTFIFDEKKENDVVICVSNFTNNNDFLENSIDSNFKREICTTSNNKLFNNDESKTVKSENEFSQNTNTNDNKLNNIIRNDSMKLLKVKEISIFKRHKLGIAILVIFLVIVILLLLNFFLIRLI